MAQEWLRIPLRRAVVAVQAARWVVTGFKGPATERSRVLSTEFVLRRIHKNHFKASKPTPIERVAFEPNAHDTDGLSVFRDAFVSAGRLATFTGVTDTYYVVRLSVAELEQTFQLKVVPAPDADQPPGHAVIPKINIADLKKNKYPSKEMQRDLAKVASKAIVHRPGDPVPPVAWWNLVEKAEAWFARR